jgi:hypothetical protein
MQRLIKRDHTPPDLFRYTHSQTGHVSQSMTYGGWMGEIDKHCRLNTLPAVPQAEAEDQLCKVLPPGWCEYDAQEQGSRPWVNTRLRLADIVAGSQQYVSMLMGGLQTVTRTEANRRARICAGCYLRVPVQGCGACQRLADFIVGDVKGKTTDYDDLLDKKACAPCRCPVRSLVHFPMSSLNKADSPDKQAAYPDFCWRKEGGVNRIE